MGSGLVLFRWSSCGSKFPILFYLKISARTYTVQYQFFIEYRRFLTDAHSGSLCHNEV